MVFNENHTNDISSLSEQKFHHFQHQDIFRGTPQLTKSLTPFIKYETFGQMEGRKEH